MTERETLALLERFLVAWNAHDVDALLACMTADGEFYASAGVPPSGAKAKGLEELRRAYSAVWTTFPDAKWTNGRHIVAGERAFSEWTFVGTRTDGTRVEVRGCDLFTIRDGKIAIKDSFRKSIA